MKRLDLWVESSVHDGRQQLPGHVRQQVKNLMGALAENPRPHNSRALDMADLDVPAGVEFRRVRLDRWRLVYAVHDAEAWVWVLGIYARPPYDYGDLPDLARVVSDR